MKGKAVYLVTVDVDLWYQVRSAWVDAKQAKAEADRLYLLDVKQNKHIERKSYRVIDIVVRGAK